MIPHSSIPSSGQVGAAHPNPTTVGKKETGEPNAFQDFLAQTNTDQKNSDQAIEDLVAGRTDSVQQVVMAVAKAEMSFQLFMEIRNKLIESYNELMRMQF